jgi:hypothetical protein
MRPRSRPALRASAGSANRFRIRRRFREAPGPMGQGRLGNVAGGPDACLPSQLACGPSPVPGRGGRVRQTRPAPARRRADPRGFRNGPVGWFCSRPSWRAERQALFAAVDPENRARGTTLRARGTAPGPPFGTQNKPRGGPCSLPLTPLAPYGAGGAANSVRLRGQFRESRPFPQEKIFGAAKISVSLCGAQGRRSRPARGQPPGRPALGW